MALSTSETELFFATDHGTLACISIQEVVTKAQALAEEHRLASLAGGRTDSPGRTYRKSIRQSRTGLTAEEVPKDTAGVSNEAMDDPDEECEMQLKQLWCVERAHACTIEHLCHCEANPSVVLTLGINCRVRLWNVATGEILGTLEQGMPDGAMYEDKGFWKFPLDAKLQVKLDLEAIAEAMFEKEVEPDEKPRRTSMIDVKPVGGAKDTASDALGMTLRPSLSAPNLGPMQGGPSHRGSHVGQPKKSSSKQSLKRDFSRLIPFRRGGGYELESSTEPYHLRSLIETTYDEDPQPEEAAVHLPPLQSGLKRPLRFDSNAVKAAHRLANALGGLGDPALAQRYRQLQ